MTWKTILMAARDAGGDKALLYRVWQYLRDAADLAACSPVFEAESELERMRR